MSRYQYSEYTGSVYIYLFIQIFYYYIKLFD